MAVCTLVRYLILIFFTLFLEESEEKCFVIINKITVTSNCDSVLDLYETNVTFKRELNVRLASGNLEEFTPVPLQNAKGVEDLWIDKAINNISDDAFKNFINIVHISLSNNELNTIRRGIFRDLSVKFLGISHCGVKRVDSGAFVNLPKLDTLGLSDNNLTSIDRNIFNNLTVQTLDLSGNQISRIEKFSFENLPNLQTLHLHDNDLTEFNVQDYVTHIDNIQSLSLDRNKLTQVTIYMLEGLSNLKVLRLDYNYISNIEPTTFAETPKLNTLALNNNFLKVMDVSTLPKAGLTQLKFLFLESNKLMYLSSNFLFRLKALTAMTIGGNPWKCPCLDLVLRWLADKNVKLYSDKPYFSGKKPVCVAPRNDNVCVYSYDEEILELFQEGNKMN